MILLRLLASLLLLTAGWLLRRRPLLLLLVGYALHRIWCDRHNQHPALDHLARASYLATIASHRW